jgi:hypothetical protein
VLQARPGVPQAHANHTLPQLPMQASRPLQARPAAPPSSAAAGLGSAGRLLTGAGSLGALATGAHLCGPLDAVTSRSSRERSPSTRNGCAGVISISDSDDDYDDPLPCAGPSAAPQRPTSGWHGQQLPANKAIVPSSFEQAPITATATIPNGQVASSCGAAQQDACNPMAAHPAIAGGVSAGPHRNCVSG